MAPEINKNALNDELTDNMKSKDTKILLQIDEETNRNLICLMKHYNVKNRVKMLRALIHSGYKSINEVKK